MSGPEQPSFLEELKRRKVARVGLVYLAVSWAVVEAADVFVPALRLPEWIVTAVAFVALVGLPLALVLAWAFDVTPEGVLRTPDASGGDTPVAWLSAKSVLVIAGVVGFALLTGWLFGSSGAREASAGALDAFGPSIGVLPFENRSGQESRAPFVEGLHDDLLTQLAKVTSIRVTPPTSMRSYAGSEMPIPAIAAELGVATVLNGGVQADEQSIRINVRLIDGATGALLWAEGYDRDLSTASIFSVQSEIAEEITRALRATLTPRERTELASVETESLEAYQAFLDGSVLGVRGDRYAAEQHLERAVSLDPEYGAAWARLAMVRSWIHRLALTGSYDLSPLLAVRARATEALERAQALGQGSPETIKAEAFYEYYVRWDLDRALDRVGRALALAPSDTDAMTVEGILLGRKGRPEDALQRFEAASALDPRSAEILEPLSWQLWELERLEEAQAVAARGLLLDPDHERVNFLAFFLEWLTGGDPSLDEYPAIAGEHEGLELLAFWNGDPASVGAYRAALEEAELDTPTRLGRLLWLTSLTGDPARRAYADSLIPLAEPLLREPEMPSDRVALALLHTVLALAYEARGSRDLMLEHTTAALQLVRPPYDQKSAASDVWVNVARLYALVGDADRALPLLEELLIQPYALIVEHLRAAEYDRIRDDSRFQALVERHAREGGGR